MMNDKKSQIIKAIKEAQVTEEKVIPVYLDHIKSAIFWTGLPQDTAERARRIMEVMIRESEKHKSMLEELLKKVEQGE